MLALFRAATAKAPDGLCHLLVMRKAPPLPIIPEEAHGAPVCGIAMCYSGPLDEEELVAPIKRFGRPLLDTIEPKPFVAHQQFLDAGQPFGRRYYWKSDYFDALPEAADETIIAHATAIASPHSAVLCMHLGHRGAVSGGGDRGRQPHGAIRPEHAGRVGDAGGGRHPHRLGADFWSAMRPFSSGGTYVNFLTQDADEERVRAAYGPELYDRLARVKAKYDPGNLFRSNQNIRPARRG